jgi:hypothetical protein
MSWSISAVRCRDIGLRVSALHAPAVRDSLRDKVHYLDRSVESGTLLTIDAANVVTERRTAPRGRIASSRPGSRRRCGGGTTDVSLYVWEGRVEVENRLQGRPLAVDVHGRHIAAGRLRRDRSGRPAPQRSMRSEAGSVRNSANGSSSATVSKISRAAW